ncbi:hypothetical protein [Listeria grayi]|uniref:hypothetical protein n=1 Tax=Listeria grayi TaxID=1641 RepID=UPI0016270D34|nr:hypothetical protein [Listeria grayi]MBC1922898.1 hypothetical protein [Listeria grayi]
MNIEQIISKYKHDKLDDFLISEIDDDLIQETIDFVKSSDSIKKEKYKDILYNEESYPGLYMEENQYLISNIKNKTVGNYLKKKLKEYTKAPLKKGSGIRYFDGKGNSWQLNYGYKNATDTIHRGAYLKTTINGKIIRVSLKRQI